MVPPALHPPTPEPHPPPLPPRHRPPPLTLADTNTPFTKPVEPPLILTLGLGGSCAVDFNRLNSAPEGYWPLRAAFALPCEDFSQMNMNVPQAYNTVETVAFASVSPLAARPPTLRNTRPWIS
ncbi:unnamed protein product [Parascedosporium putredinis]|uniref:Uncharacterized protein n=1 Tax=Parascedosporium putredinis TaxID=1442378 RepID=A0A9P1MDZ0_9PEZI|nr:unnamed protein product [Parascedosporium putredinis]CAI8003543.1 unnamed protein product [Parascedosporium putredinis]